jgi:trehalose 6-phosphate phosphatase
MSQPPADLVSEIEARTRSARLISLFLDFDGTLVPIAGDPATPRLDPSAAATLRLLSSRHGLVTTIISGRAIEDLFTRIRLEGLIYAGNHGLEIFGRQFRFVEPAASARREELARLCEELALELQPFDGAIVECKGLTASIHYRMAVETAWAAIQQTVYAATARNGALFRVNPGRKVFDIVPRTNWHKGAAVEWINGHLGETEVLTVYLGDDASDEDAFAVLPDAVTVKVGAAAATCARYQLPGPAAVHELLLWLADSVTNGVGNQ